MARIPGFETTYKVLAKWKEIAFRESGSLFTPGRSIWTAQNSQDLYTRFWEHPDESPRSFVEKLHDQLNGCPAETLQLAAEMLFIQTIPPSGMHKPAKIDLIQKILSWAETPVEVPEDLWEAIDQGMTSDMSFLNHRPFHLAYFLKVMNAWFEKETDERETLLHDPWSFKQFLQSIEVKAGQPMREIFYHLVFPDEFEGISSRKHKKLIEEAFLNKLPKASADIDQNILAIRQVLESEAGHPINFYADDIRIQWQGVEPPPPQFRRKCFLAWLQKAANTQILDENEIQPKLEVAQRLSEAKRAVLADDPNWMKLLKDAIEKKNFLTAWQTHGKFVNLVQDSPNPAKDLLKLIWEDGEATNAEKMRAFDQALDKDQIKGPGARAQILSFLMMAVNVEEFPIFRHDAYHTAYKLADFEKLPAMPDAVDQYNYALSFLDELIAASSAWEQPLRNRLEAQSACWLLVKYNNRPSDWSEGEWELLLRFRNGEIVGPGTETEIKPEDEQDEEAIDLLGLADELLIDASYLQKLVQLLDDKRQIVLYGPPGTGKTFVAHRLAQALAQSIRNVTIVQFHPSYTYEDFFEGFRPTLADGNAGFQLHAGPLKRLAQQAAAKPNETFVLVIDEINRGNLAKIFGELYFLLEYRDHAIDLQYSQEKFSLPENLRIIGTMNTADRSIALIDSALRRRFYFLEFFPDRPPVQGLLRRWLSRHQADMSWIADMIDTANAGLDERHLTIGPSYFMKKGLTEDWARLIWMHAIIPYLEEHFFGQPERIDDFTFDKIRQKSLPKTVELATE
jgi:hypothetical protein